MRETATVRLVPIRRCHESKADDLPLAAPRKHQVTNLHFMGKLVTCK